MRKFILILISLIMLLFAGCGSTAISVVEVINQTQIINTTINEVINPVAQFHRIEEFEADNVDTWYNITWDMIVPDETTNGFFTLTDNNNSIIINDFEGVVRVQGCIHPYNDYASRLENTLRVRTMIDGNEARCLQASATKDRRAGGVDIIVYSGTIAVHNNSKVQIQFMTEDTNMILKGDTEFNNPVSASVNYEKISIFSD